MADYLFPTTGQRAEYTPGTTEKMRALERRQKIAAALIEQGMQPKQARQAGRFVVAPSMMEQLSGPLTTALGSLASVYLDKEREGVQEEETKRVADALQQWANAQEDVREWKGRTVPGTGRPEVVAQPSNLEDMLQASAPQEPTIQLRKPTAEVADAVFARQQPQQFKVSPEFDGPPAQFAAYRPGVQGAAAVPDRRETKDEALDRVGGEGTAQGVKEGWIDPGPIVRPDLAAAISEANRPDQAARPRTPAEYRAADMALMASGVPNAWPIVHLASQQREADKARAEMIADRVQARAERYDDLAKARADKRDAERNRREDAIAETERKRDAATATLEQKKYYDGQIVELRRQGLEQANRFHADSMEIQKLKAGQTPEQIKAEGQGTLSELTQSLRDLYTQLAQAGGITDTSKSSIDNILPYFESTGVGQVISGALGTERQSIRNSIESARPLLLQAIAKATGLKATQLNSNIELQSYLKAATSTSHDLQANMRAADMLDKLYGTGSLLRPGSPPGAESPLDRAMSRHGGK